MKKFVTVLLAIVMLMSLSTHVFTFADELCADGEGCSHHEHNIIAMLDITEGERLVKINEDGSFITEIIEEEGVFLFNPTRTCDHELYFAGQYSETKSYNGSDSKNCYKTRIVERTRCRRCGRQFLVYKPWKYYGHNFPWFGDTCKKCNYKKK